MVTFEWYDISKTDEYRQCIILEQVKNTGMFRKFLKHSKRDVFTRIGKIYNDIDYAIVSHGLNGTMTNIENYNVEHDDSMRHSCIDSRMSVEGRSIVLAKLTTILQVHILFHKKLQRDIDFIDEFFQKPKKIFTKNIHNG